jgi:hypothetical protein
MIYLIWSAEFFLESLGAILNIKTSRVLSTLLAFCAASDAVTYFFYQSARQNAYAWSYWYARVGKYLILIWLGCEICGMFAHNIGKVQTRVMAAFISLCAGAFVTVFFCQGETLKNRLLDGEIGANMILFALVAIGWISRQKLLNRHWKWIAAGFVTLIGWDLLCTILWEFWAGARHWYPLGTVVAYAIWIVGPMRCLGEFRQSLGHRVEVTEKIFTRVI